MVLTLAKLGNLGATGMSDDQIKTYAKRKTAESADISKPKKLTNRRKNPTFRHAVSPINESNNPNPASAKHNTGLSRVMGNCEKKNK